VLISCWSSKGGAGTTVVAASLALLLARRGPAGALLADLRGDAPAALGVPEPSSPGIAGWLAAGADVPPDALARLEERLPDGLALLPRGRDDLEPGRADLLAALLARDARPVVADCGAEPDGAALVVASAATRSVLVTRPCFLSLRRALLAEAGRSLSRRDVEDCIGAPVVAEVSVDPAVARAVDAGLLATRLPRGLVRELGRAA
jgi:MinD-like ATPase involved in chromosome partitioning or flagellar assembly